MNVAQPRPRSWTPHIVLFSIILHVVVIYYAVVAFGIADLPLPTDEPNKIDVVRYVPPDPVINPEPEPIKDKPRFRIRTPTPQPIITPVEPAPLTPQPGAESTSDADVIAVNQPIQEQPVSQSLPGYPRTALERGVEGRVVMSITIMPDGSVRDVRVVNAQPRGYFENAHEAPQVHHIGAFRCGRAD
jgi:outer membrane biosynthesis protein TonB